MLTDFGFPHNICINIIHKILSVPNPLSFSFSCILLHFPNILLLNPINPYQSPTNPPITMTTVIILDMFSRCKLKIIILENMDVFVL
jgi:hypothetical protein